MAGAASLRAYGQARWSEAKGTLVLRRRLKKRANRAARKAKGEGDCHGSSRLAYHKSILYPGFLAFRAKRYNEHMRWEEEALSLNERHLQRFSIPSVSAPHC